MNRLVGGDYLLDLSSIEIEESEDGTTKTNITDADVLEQLANLKKYIKNPEMAKPVWVKLKNGENDELVIARGTFAVVDTGEFEICVQLDGYKLVIFIEFTQATLSDSTPIDDWYIDTNDAKYLFTSDAQALAGQLSDFTGDVEITGDVEVNGEFNADKVTGDEIIENMSGYSFDVSSRSDAITYDDVYAGVVKNGNKLTFVCALNITATEYSNEFRIGKFIIPSNVLAKLYPTTIGGYNFLAYVQLMAVDSSAISSVKQVNAYVEKLTDGIAINSLLNDLTDTKTYYIRIELTFLLSDNLIPEQAGE